MIKANGRPSLTARQRQVLKAIAEYLSKHGYSPTIRELGAALGINSTNGVSDHLKALRRKGYIRQHAGAARGYVLVDADQVSKQADRMLMVRGPDAAQRKTLSKRQAMVFEFIVAEIMGKQLAPSLREIGAYMDINSTNGVTDHLKALQRKGYILRSQGACRGIVAIVDAGE